MDENTTPKKVATNDTPTIPEEKGLVFGMQISAKEDTSSSPAPSATPISIPPPKKEEGEISESKPPIMIPPLVEMPPLSSFEKTPLATPAGPIIPVSIPILEKQKEEHAEPIIPTKPESSSLPNIPQKHASPDIPKKEEKKLAPTEQSKTLTPTISEKEIEHLKASAHPINIPKPARKPPNEGLVSAPSNFSKGEPVPATAIKAPIVPAQNAANTAGGIVEIPTLRTYKQDVTSAIKDQKTSLVRMVLEERKSNAKKDFELSPTSRKNFPIIILSIFFLVLTAGVLYFAFFKAEDKKDALLSMRVTPLISTETNKEIPIDELTSGQLTDLISYEISIGKIRLDTLEYLFFTKKTVSQGEGGVFETKEIVPVKDLLRLLNLPIPDMLARTLKPDYMLGVHAFNNNQAFLILKTDYYDTAFAGMLSWERSMHKDLLPLFGRKNRLTDLENSHWGDLILKNKDMRVLKYPSGDIALLYAFKDQKTIIISTSQDTFFKISDLFDLSQGRKIQ